MELLYYIVILRKQSTYQYVTVVVFPLIRVSKTRKSDFIV